MKPSHFCKSFIQFLSATPLLLLIILICLFSHAQPLCHTDDRTALLEFKDSFIIRRRTSAGPLAYPKVASWKPNENDDCCSWDGVECDESNSHAIALNLDRSCLYGSISSNSSLFKLSHLRSLNLANNHFNRSQIPSRIGHLLSLRYVDLSNSVFTGQIPLEISQLSNLSYLDLSSNWLELRQPDFSTLLRNFSNIQHLDLSFVHIYSPIPVKIMANFSSLKSLYLRSCGLYGEFPNDIFQLPNLEFLSLTENKRLTGSFPEFRFGSPLKKLWLWKTSFFGHIPSSIGNLGSLNLLDVGDCGLSGQLPSSLGGLPNLQSLYLDSNDLSGTVDFNMFLNMKNLTVLRLSDNKLSVLMSRSNITGNVSTNVPKFEVLLLASCNLTSFPDFLRYQDRLKALDLSTNHIHGKVPNWIWNTSIEALHIASNLFTGFDGDVVLNSRSLRILDLSSNRFKGLLPIPPPSIVVFDVSHNDFSGEISVPLFFNISTSLKLLDLSHNNLSGALPECLRNTKHNLSRGGIPQMCSFGRTLRMMDLSYNQFQGRIPQSLLANCIELEVLKLENNHFSDVFPSWLGTLPKLKVLIMRSNHFHSAITSKPAFDYEFPSLRIVDLSHNNFSGPLPSGYFQKWKAMKYFDARKSSYLDIMIKLTLVEGLVYHFSYTYSITITNKGKDMEYEKIQEVFTVLDLSSNKFEGGIPECIGNLQGLQVLNLSNNMLDGIIPSSLSNVTQLESLDLSRNNLSGKIPQQLAQLTFLAFFNVAFNRLSGLVPQGSQFSTFDNSSYEGNTGLIWGLPRSSTPLMPPNFASNSYEEEDGQDSSETWFESYWMTILPGFVGGLVFGVAIEHVLAVDKYEWFIKALNFGTFS